MTSHLYHYSEEIKKKIQDHPLSNLNSFSDLRDIVNNCQTIIQSNHEVQEYWVCIFLMALETYDEEKQLISPENLRSYLSLSIDILLSASRSPEANILFFKTLDDIVDDQDYLIESLDELFKTLEVFLPLKNISENFEFTFSKQANITLASIWGVLKDFEEGEILTHPQIPAEVKRIHSAFKFGLQVEFITEELADLAIEYIEESCKFDTEEACRGFEVTQMSHEMIIQLLEMCSDDEVKNELIDIQKKINEVRPYILKAEQGNPGVQEPEVIPDFLSDEIYGIDSSLVKIIYPAVYNMPKGNTQIAIHKATYCEYEVCAKVYSPKPGFPFDYPKAYNEIRVYQKLSLLSSESNCFLKYYGTYFENNSLHMIMEWIPNNLMDFINNLESIKFRFLEVQYVAIILKLLTSFTLMKQIGILHRDIKPHNLLVDDNWNIKIIDFDFCLVKTQDIVLSKTETHKIQGTDGYFAPEQIGKKGMAEFNPEKVDVYILGLVFYQLLTFKNVKNTTKSEMFSDIDAYPGFCRETKDFLKTVLTENPSQRPTFSSALALLHENPTTRTLSSALD